MHTALALLLSLALQPVTLPDYSTISKADNYATSAEYETAKHDTRYQMSRASYESDGLTVYAYVYAPVAKSGRRPVVIFNRGSYVWKEFSGEYLTTFRRLADGGFIIVAPMLRGSGGGEGHDDMGGADLNDVLNTVKLLKELPGADTDNVFMYGESRGGMMTYQAIREHYPMRAAAVYGAFTDLQQLAGPGGKFASVAAAIWPDYANKQAEIVRRRSAIQWPESFETPVLIMHGGSDKDLPPSHALALAAKLQELGKPYELVIRAGANHVLTQWRVERDALAVEWFRRHMLSSRP